MAKYLILLYEDEAGYANATPEALQEIRAEHDRFRQQAESMGVAVTGGAALQPTATATSVRGDVLTDGPFVETKENIGGYYLIEADDLDQALKAARLVPTPFGGVEVRPIWDM
jgi:hypothetical protein